MMTHDDHHQPINYNLTPPSFPNPWILVLLIKRSCGERCNLGNEDERFIECYTPTMKDLASRDVSRFTTMEYRTMCA
ncbi:putative succinate dehydrogenase (quinone) [Helianthus anomalus]